MHEKRDINLFLHDSLNSIKQIKIYVKSMNFKEYVGDKKTQDAVIRNLEIIGEAIKNIPVSFKNLYPLIEWKAFAGMRDILIHHYFGVDSEIIWETIKKDILILEEKLKEILNNKS